MKTQFHHPDDFFFAEAAGLEWLKNGGLPTPEIYSVTAHSIELENLLSDVPTAEHAYIFGQQLARCHRSGASAFGSKPPHYTGELYIGEKPMPSNTFTSWGQFYALERVLPFVAEARALDMLSDSDAIDTYQACEIIASGIFDNCEPPARIHGDLWSGNVLYSTSHVYAVDPAAHGGNRETDLAMLHLFGCSQLESILQGYQDEYPLQPGWQARIPLHQMHPLAVHAAGQGVHYGDLLGKAARKVLTLARTIKTI